MELKTVMLYITFVNSVFIFKAHLLHIEKGASQFAPCISNRFTLNMNSGTGN